MGRPYLNACAAALAHGGQDSADVAEGFREAGHPAGLERVRTVRPLPQSITVDNGGELAGRALAAWAYQHHAKLDFIRPGKFGENGFIASFNGKLRDECLNSAVFLSIANAREKPKRWRHDYNHLRRHGSLAVSSQTGQVKINQITPSTVSEKSGQTHLRPIPPSR